MSAPGTPSMIIGGILIFLGLIILIIGCLFKFGAIKKMGTKVVDKTKWYWIAIIVVGAVMTVGGIGPIVMGNMKNRSAAPHITPM